MNILTKVTALRCRGRHSVCAVMRHACRRAPMHRPVIGPACATSPKTYLTAMLAHAPKQAPLALNARYTENGAELSVPDGLWRTLDKLGTYRLYVADPQDAHDRLSWPRAWRTAHPC